jgi:hypothetical protein
MQASPALEQPCSPGAKFDDYTIECGVFAAVFAARTASLSDLAALRGTG